jgi:ATP-dependent HslUV protease ATP-binding subunit HslU
MEKLLEEVSFGASTGGASELVVNAAFVEERLGSLAGSEDLSRYIL